MTCETCRYWMDLRTCGLPVEGQCRRYPPLPVTGPSAWSGATYMEADRAAAVWPCTDAYDGCGEHTPKAPRND